MLWNDPTKEILVNKVKFFIVALTATAATVLGFAAPAQAAAKRVVGSVSVQQACRNQFTRTDAVTVNNTVYGWRCRFYGTNGNPIYISGIDLNKQCRVQYGSTATAGFLDYNNPYSWRCYR